MIDIDAIEPLLRKRGGLRLDMDGPAWCAMFDDFRNLGEDTAGFGDTPEEAILDLLKQETTA